MDQVNTKGGIKMEIELRGLSPERQGGTYSSSGQTDGTLRPFRRAALIILRGKLSRHIIRLSRVALRVNNNEYDHKE